MYPLLIKSTCKNTYCQLYSSIADTCIRIWWKWGFQLNPIITSPQQFYFVSGIFIQFVSIDCVVPTVKAHCCQQPFSPLIVDDREPCEPRLRLYWHIALMEIDYIFLNWYQPTNEIIIQLKWKVETKVNLD